MTKTAVDVNRRESGGCTAGRRTSGKPSPAFGHLSLKRRGFASSALVGGLAAVLALLGVVGMVMSRQAPAVKVLAQYSTSLKERTPHQRHNACRAAARLNGATIEPGATLSFNRVLGGWTASQGYLKAPVSYDGVLIDDFGGGVCETSTVMYNAALLAGLTVTERHAHTFAPSYIPPGRDAAVAYSNIDLKVQNPYPVPVKLRFLVEHGNLICKVEGDVHSQPNVRVYSQIMDRLAPPIASPKLEAGSKTAKWNVHGRSGFRVAVYRETSTGSGSIRQLLSDNTYQPMAGIR